MKNTRFPLLLTGIALAFFVAGCARTEIIESPKTTFVAETEEPKDPELIWTSRTMTQNFDYLGTIKVRSWTYDGALERLKEAGKQMRADAIIDVNFQKVGFLSTMDAFAIKFRTRNE